nr:hypothetical protein [Tetrasphaera sp. HKS02]
MPPQLQGGLHLQVLSVEALLHEPRALHPSGGPVLELRQWWTPPEREGLVDQVCRPVRLAVGEPDPRLRHEAPEPLSVYGVGVDPQRVTRGRGLDRSLAQDLAKPDDAPLDDLGGRVWHRVAPQGVDQGIPRHGAPELRHQRGEDHAIAVRQPA